MIRWYRDNSELRSSLDARIPDILIFGGIAVNEEARDRICSIIRVVQEAEAAMKIKRKKIIRGLASRNHRREVKSAYRHGPDFPFMP